MSLTRPLASCSADAELFRADGVNAALRYLEGRELPARLDWKSIRRLQRLLNGGAG